ncbi:hypothetical protein [Halomonas sp. MM17-29]|jgi:hypothetical protein|uniref:hypothetical protein n=1 Tax=Halomonas sp. MM17-29 TaxID=2917741 RepID=UPI001EF62C45|nr:hypothetical protein [Halomonas sp. MM17-29]
MAMFEIGAETATAEAWETALREICQLRLGGKAAVHRGCRGGRKPGYLAAS